MRIILWFTRDLRLKDNAALNAAIRDASSDKSTNNKSTSNKSNNNNGKLDIIPVYILDTTHPQPVQGAAGWWLHHSLNSLDRDLRSVGGKLFLFRGGPTDILKKLLEESRADAVYFSRAYDPHTALLQGALQAFCQKNNIGCRRFAGHLMVEPEALLNKQGNPFQVFTPYYNTFRQRNEVTPASKNAPTFTLRTQRINGEKLADWKLLPKKPDWAASFGEHWQPGEKNAWTTLANWAGSGITDYSVARDFPAIDATSALSPYLSFGEISPRAVWHYIKSHVDPGAAEPYLRQLVWREFSYSLLHYWPHLPEKSFRPLFEKFPWRRHNGKNLRAWQRGLTGYPIVDAGMRQLWQSGWMHNRVRMITASFLTKHLLIHWKHGASWFWDTLVDADLANNSAGWQWVAGSGADAAPYFRIFNPVIQGEKFDPRGDYIRRWVPELSRLPDKYLHQPWTAPAIVLADAQIKLGKTYPEPIVDHATARAEALAAYNSIK